MVTSVEREKTLDAIKGAAAIQEFCVGYWKSSILFTANKLHIFTILADNEMSSADIASRLRTETKSTERFLDACVSIGLLEKRASKYKNSAFAKNFLVEGREWYQGDILAHWADMYAAGHFEHLDVALKEGKPVPRSMLHHASYDERRDGLRNWVMGMHNWAMAGHAQLLANSVDLTNCKSLIDVGGGPGTYSVFMCKRFPTLTSTVVDDTEILRIAKQIIERFGVSDRIILRPGDFRSYPTDEHADSILLSNVLHMGKSDFCVEMLEKAYSVLKNGGKLIVQEWFLDSDKTSPLTSALFSLHIMARLGGEVYSFDEIMGWLRDIGFVQVHNKKLQGLWSLVIAEKK